jgi:hypothetical protein
MGQKLLYMRFDVKGSEQLPVLEKIYRSRHRWFHDQDDKSVK